MKQDSVLVVASMTLVLLGACGEHTYGPSGNSAAQPQPAEPASGPAVRLGVNHRSDGTPWLTGYAYYEVSPSAQVFVDGDRVAAGDLQISEGEVVLVSGTLDNEGGPLTADSVRLVHLLDAPVDALDLEHGRMTVLGQTVLVNAASCLEISCLTPDAQFAVGERVVVSGYPLAAENGVLATRVAPSTASGELLAAGIVHAPDGAAGKFSIGALTVHYASAALHNFSVGGPQEAQLVIVRGVRPPGATELTATSVRRAPALSATVNADALLQGIVSSSDSSSLLLAGYPVEVPDSARTTCPARIALNQDVSVHGKVAADGNVVADSVCGVGDTSARILGPIESIDPTYGTLSILGFRVQPSPATLGSAPTPMHVGDFVAAQVTRAPLGDIWVAITLEEPPGGSTPRLVMLQDDVDLAAPAIRVRGHAIATDAATHFSSNGIPSTSGSTYTYGHHQISSEQFFSGQWISGPGSYDLCGPPELTIDITRNADGSLTATSVNVEFDFC